MCTTAVLDLSSTLNIANHCDLKALEKAVKVPWSFLDSNIPPKSMLNHSSWVIDNVIGSEVVHQQNDFLLGP